MQVILLERVPKLGFIGDEVTVKPGYARNYLLPQKKALRATKANRELFESQKHEIEANNIKQKSDAENAAKKIEGLVLSMVRQAGDSGQLYGSVTAKDIADASAAENLKIHKSQVYIATPIKMLGVHTAHVILHPEVHVDILINVAKSQDEAKSQLDDFRNPEAAANRAAEKVAAEMAEYEAREKAAREAAADFAEE